jgi:hypothetical protein
MRPTHHPDTAAEIAAAEVTARALLIVRLATLAKAAGEPFDAIEAIENDIHPDEACAEIASRVGLPFHRLRASCRAAFH